MGVEEWWLDPKSATVENFIIAKHQREREEKERLNTKAKATGGDEGQRRS
jgi:hypothetical protein